jgi:predicted acylesterase/phospholipase RssA
MAMRILSVDGGGYLGLATAALIEGVERHFGTPLHQRFDMFCGSSTGAIIAVALATGKTGTQIVDIYRRHGRHIFAPTSGWRKWLASQKSLLRPKYSDRPLATALHEAFGDLTLADIRARGKRALVTAFCTTTGQPRIFKTDFSDQPTPFAAYLLRDIVLASSAAPTYFPLVALTNPLSGKREVFCDGGLVANHPAMVGYAEALAELHVAPREVRLLSLATPQSDLIESPAESRDLHRGLWGWRRNIASIFIESNSMISHQALRRIFASYGPSGPLYERITMPNPTAIPFDNADARTTALLLEMGARAAEDPAILRRLAPFLADPAATP